MSKKKQIEPICMIPTEAFEHYFNSNATTCPLCGCRFGTSEYLWENIRNPKTAYFANLITHYRHNHITSWNRCWGRYGGYYRGYWFKDYDIEKSKVNERAKRQLIRKAHSFFINLGFTVEDLLELETNTSETVAVIQKFLPSREHLDDAA